MFYDSAVLLLPVLFLYSSFTYFNSDVNILSLLSMLLINIDISS